MNAKGILLSALLTCPLGGCVVAAVAGATYGVVKYERNEAVKDLQAPINRVWKACKEALAARGYRLPENLPLELTEEQDRVTIEESGYRVHLVEQPGGWTRLRVRIGTFDGSENRRKAGLLLESIESRL